MPLPSDEEILDAVGALRSAQAALVAAEQAVHDAQAELSAAKDDEGQARNALNMLLEQNE